MYKERNFLHKTISMLNTFNPVSTAITLDYVKKCSEVLSDSIYSEYEPNIIIAIGRDGIYPAHQISKKLEKETDYIHVSKYSRLKLLDEIPGFVGFTRRIKGKITKNTVLKPILIRNIQTDIENKKVLLVDDEAGSGNTMEFSKNILRKAKPKEIKTAVLFRHDLNYTPDFFAVTNLNRVRITPWDMASPYYDQFLTEFSKITI